MPFDCSCSQCKWGLEGGQEIASFRTRWPAQISLPPLPGPRPSFSPLGSRQTNTLDFAGSNESLWRLERFQSKLLERFAGVDTAPELHIYCEKPPYSGADWEILVGIWWRPSVAMLADGGLISSDAIGGYICKKEHYHSSVCKIRGGGDLDEVRRIVEERLREPLERWWEAELFFLQAGNRRFAPRTDSSETAELHNIPTLFLPLVASPWKKSVNFGVPKEVTGPSKQFNSGFI